MSWLRRVVALLCISLFAGPALAGEAPRCLRGDIVLWGDGEHDDTAALNAWFRGEEVGWAASGEPVGDAIADRVFRLSDAVYVPGGSGRVLQHFRMVWPERGEIVTGGTIAAGSDAAAAPAITGVTITGGDDSEGVPFETPDIAPVERGDPRRCATSHVFPKNQDVYVAFNHE